MKQHEAVIQAMRDRGGFSTLAMLYAEALRVPGSHWSTKTPQASIRRIVQEHPAFFRIRPGLWGLCEMRREIEQRLLIPPGTPGRKPQATEFDHTYFQGLAVQWGNFQRFGTTVPSQDRNKQFLGRPLGGVCSLDKCPEFTYPHLISKAKFVDVVWSNERRLPSAFIEIEFTTDFNNALIKFCEFQDFRARLTVIADAACRRAYDAKIGLAAFRPIRDLVSFIDFEGLARSHANAAERCSLDTVSPRNT
jgi:hypothetical protein